MYLRFSISGQVQLSRVLLNVSNAVKDWTPALEKSAEDLIEVFSYDVFESEGGAIGEAWDPLSAAYAKRKEKKYPGNPILVATGLMQDSFTRLVDTTSLKIGNSAEYFKYHQSSAPRTKLPRRVMMKLTLDLREIVVKNFQRQFLERASTT